MQDENLSTHLSKISKEEAKKSFKKHIPNITLKLRNEQKLQAQNNRFKVVNCFRTLDESKVSTNEEKNELTVVDIEQKTEGNNVLFSDNDTKLCNNYVYDLYYMDDVNDMVLDNMLRCSSCFAYLSIYVYVLVNIYINLTIIYLYFLFTYTCSISFILISQL